MKKNLRYRVLTGQLQVIEDVTDWSIDTLGINVTYQVTSEEKVGEEVKKIVNVQKKWLNTAGVISVEEEFAK